MNKLICILMIFSFLFLQNNQVFATEVKKQKNEEAKKSQKSETPSQNEQVSIGQTVTNSNPTDSNTTPPVKISPKLRRKQCLEKDPSLSMEELKACALGKSK